MAFLDTTPFVKETYQVEYYGGGVTRNRRERITILVQYPCDAAGYAGETIPATRNTAVQSPGTTCDLQKVDVDLGYSDLTGLCSLIYEIATDWELIV